MDFAHTLSAQTLSPRYPASRFSGVAIIEVPPVASVPGGQPKECFKVFSAYGEINEPALRLGRDEVLLSFLDPRSELSTPPGQPHHYERLPFIRCVPDPNQPIYPKLRKLTEAPNFSALRAFLGDLPLLMKNMSRSAEAGLTTHLRTISLPDAPTEQDWICTKAFLLSALANQGRATGRPQPKDLDNKADDVIKVGPSAKVTSWVLS
jgi:hypothetical protein